MANEADPQKQIDMMISKINNIFYYDPQLVFPDTFERISQLLTELNDIFATLIVVDKNYWISYNIILALMPLFERLIFYGYSDQVLEILLSLNYSVNTNIIFCTSRFLPLRMYLFSTICFTMANTKERRDKDAENFITNFKNEIQTLKELETTNLNGLSEQIITCTGESVLLSSLFDSCLKIIELVSIHFSSTEEVEFEKPWNPKHHKNRGKKHVKDEQKNDVMPLPSEHTVKLIINSFSSPSTKSDYLSKYSMIVTAWANPDCKLDIMLLHRLLFAFIRSGTFSEIDQLVTILPNDPIVRIAAGIKNDDHKCVSDVLNSLNKDQISKDYQFFVEIALIIWKKFTVSAERDSSTLNGVFHVLVNSPQKCPLQTALIALNLCWYYLDNNKLHECVETSSIALKIVEDFRDIFEVRKSSKLLHSTNKIPNKPLDQSFLLFSKWLECVQTDLFTVWVRSQLCQGLHAEVEEAKKKYDAHIEDTKKMKENMEKLYGVLSANQKEEFEKELNKEFKPPKHSESVEAELLKKFNQNLAAKALIYIQMSFFRPNKAPTFLEKARICMNELREIEKNNKTSPLIYVIRTEIAFSCIDIIPGAKTIAVYGKESNGNEGITTANTFISGCGVQQERSEPFIIEKLKPNTRYAFAFGGYDSSGGIVDTLTKPMTVITSHKISNELIWSYIATAAYNTKDLQSFDISISHLLQCYAYVFEPPPESSFFNNTNPFNRFMLNTIVISEPAPLLRSLTNNLLMAARLFSNKPLHASSFHHLALKIAEILNNGDLILTVCQELFAILQPLLVNKYHTQHIIHPLIRIVNALKVSKSTKNDLRHQMILTRTSFALESVLLMCYKEKKISQYIINTIIETSHNDYRSKFLMFCSKSQILEMPTGFDQTLPYYAAELFRLSPEKSYDELFNKYKSDPLFPKAATYICSAAYDSGNYQSSIQWCHSALEYLRTLLHEPEILQKNNRKNNTRSSTKVTKKKTPPPKNSKNKNENQKQSADDQLLHASAQKIQANFLKFYNRTKSIAKYYDINKSRSALKLILAMSLMETDPLLTQMPILPSDQASRSISKGSKGFKSSNRISKKIANDDVSYTLIDYPIQIINAIFGAFCLSIRSDCCDIMRASCNLLSIYLDSLPVASPFYQMIANIMPTLATKYLHLLPLNEDWAMKIIEKLFIILIRDDKVELVITLLTQAVGYSEKCASLSWMLYGQTVSNEIISAYTNIQRRDASYNSFYVANDILNRNEKDNIAYFEKDPCTSDINILIRAVTDIAISLQHKQKLSLSANLLQRLGFILYERNEKKLAIKKFCEALESHFRVVNVHEKVNSILNDETDQSFYSKHSYSGCLSIIVLCSYISSETDRLISIQVCKLAAFACSALFSNSSSCPSKQIDFATYEPTEIVPGVDIFEQLDPQQPLLEPPKAKFIAQALDKLVVSMGSHEMYFELFKPISFALHFFRFIIRDKKCVARFRIQSVLNCCRFGLISQAVSIMNDIIISFGSPRITRESTTTTQAHKRVFYNQSEPLSNTSNSECIKIISSSQSMSAVINHYGSLISYQYIMAIARIIGVICESSDPNSDVLDTPMVRITTQSSRFTKGKRNSSRRKDEKIPAPEQVEKSDSASTSANQTLSTDSIDNILKISELILIDVLSKEFKIDQYPVKYELQVELAFHKLRVWNWTEAVKIALDVMNDIQDLSKSYNSDEIGIIERSLCTLSGLMYRAVQIVGIASYNLHDTKMAEKYGSIYIKSLLLIKKADIEQAAKLLTQIAIHPPLTMYHKEYILACGQLATLFCFNKNLIEICQATISVENREKLNPINIISKLTQSSWAFYIEQLGIKDNKNLYLLHTHLLIRLKLLEVVVSMNFGGTINPVKHIEEASFLMSTLCPYVSRGLSFLLQATSTRIQMQEFIKNHPNVINMWNKDVNPLQLPKGMHYDIGVTERLSEQMLSLFSLHPDCVVHPMAQQTILDYSILAGISSNDDGKRVNRSYSALATAYAVKSSRRFIQSIISQQPETPPQGISVFLANDNKDATARALAASYYAHVCLLDIPLFDTEVLEIRTLLFFKAFEYECSSFKTLSRPQDQPLPDPGTIIGQWYRIDARLFRTTDQVHETMTIRSARTTTTTTSGYTSSSRATTSSGTRGASSFKGTLYFFMGVATDPETEPKKPLIYVPFMYVAQFNDIKTICNEMAEVEIEIEEAKNMANAGRDDVGTGKDYDRSGRRKSPVRIPLKGSGEQSQVFLLKNQVNLALKNAELKWEVAIHKFEAAINKSSKIVNSLENTKLRWTQDVKVTGIDRDSANTISHMFSVQYGVNDKDINLTKWIISLSRTSTPSEQLPQLK